MPATPQTPEPKDPTTNMVARVLGLEEGVAKGAADHVHRLDIPNFGLVLVSTINSGDQHSHIYELRDGRLIQTEPADSGEGHTHYVTIGNESFTSGVAVPPNIEVEMKRAEPTLEKQLTKLAKKHNKAFSAPGARISAEILAMVYKRATEKQAAAAFPGADLEAWGLQAVDRFLVLASGEQGGENEDLLAESHPSKGGPADPWAAVEDEEERIALLQRAAVEEVDRPSLRKKTDADLASINGRLERLYNLHFAELTGIEVSATGLEKASIVVAAAHVHEELERRGLLDPESGDAHDSYLYSEAWGLREQGFAVAKQGAVYQTKTAIALDLGMGQDFEVVLLRETNCGDVEVMAKRWNSNGSRDHLPLKGRWHDFLPMAKAEREHQVATLVVEKGAEKENYTEFHLSGGICGALHVSKTSIRLAEDVRPYVLSEDAVAKGWMPEEGESAIPSTLAQDIPIGYRYWKAAVGEDPRAIRDALVQSGILDDLAPVNGSLHKVNASWTLSEPCDVAAGEFAEAPSTAQTGVFAALKVLPEFDFAPLSVAQKFATALAKGELEPSDGDLLLAFDDDAAEDTEIDALVAHLQKHTGGFLVAHPDSPEAREGLAAAGCLFTMRAAPDHLFVSSRAPVGKVKMVGNDLPDPEIARAFKAFFKATNMSKTEYERFEAKGGKPKAGMGELLGKTTLDDWSPADAKRAAGYTTALKTARSNKAEADTLLALGYNPKRGQSVDEDESEEAGLKRKMKRLLKRESRILKADEEEERLVYGIVLEPETVDAQDDVYSEEEVRTAAHVFMEEFRNTGLMHRALVNDHVKILESYLAPVAMTVSGVQVRKGTWLMAMRVKNDKMWDAVKTGELTGFSIGGHARREPDAT